MYYIMYTKNVTNVIKMNIPNYYTNFLFSLKIIK